MKSSKQDKLIRLPNGSWVRPSTVTAVRPLPETESVGTVFGPRVVVEYGKTGVEILDAASFEAAGSLADLLAGQVNAGDDDDAE